MKRHLSNALLAAALLWFVMFSPWTATLVPFWPAMTCSALLLTCLAFLFGGRPAWHFRLSDVLWGVAIAVVLWGVFWLGDKVSQWMFDFARPQVDLIYGMKDGQSPLWVSLALLLIIGPAEELFWRDILLHPCRR